MKKNDLILMIAIAAYSYLLYQQSAGVNFLIFNVVLLILVLLRDEKLIKNRNWLIVVGCSLTTSIFTFIYGNTLTTIANITSLLLLSAMSFSRNSSVIIGLLHSIYSTAASMVFMVLDSIERKAKKTEKQKNNFWPRILIFTAGFLILLILFLLYRASNPLFNDFTKDINLDFISISWIGFTLLGLLLMYGFFYHKTIEPLHNFDISSGGKLTVNTDGVNNDKGIRKFMSLDTEWRSGLVLLLLLNVLIIFVNILDAVYLWSGTGLPEGIDLCKSLHQSVDTLILSIIIAICIILFFFRSEINFYKKSRIIKFFAILWVIQNIFMVISTIYRNQIYISEFGLTHKRIGVYVYLALCVAGLASTFIKIVRSKSNWYLFRFNGWSFFLALVIIAGFNWDSIITKFNISRANSFDSQYLLDLSASNIPDLLILDNEKKLKGNYTVNYAEDPWAALSGKDYISKTYQNVLDKKMYDFLDKYLKSGWKSYCIDKQKVYNDILELEKAGKITTIDLSGHYLSGISALSSFTHIKYLDTENNSLSNLGELKPFINLEKLDLSNNKIDSIEKLPALTKLIELKLSRNTINELKPLKNISNLESLYLDNNGTVNFKSLPKLDKLTYLDISGNQIKDYSYLRNLKSLKTLVLMRTINRDISTIPEMKNLESLNISDNNISATDYILMKKLATFQNLEELNISQNNLQTLRAFELYPSTNAEQSNKPIYPELKKLNVAADRLTGLEGLNNFPALEELIVSGNDITNLDRLKELKSLKRLSIASNQIKDINVLQSLTNLDWLDISGNSISNPELLKNISSLDTLIANRTDWTNISFLSELTNLRSLNLIGNFITDLLPLQNLTKLETLDISNNPVKDFSPLYKMKNLKSLYIPNVDSAVYETLQNKLPDTMIYENYVLMTLK